MRRRPTRHFEVVKLKLPPRPRRSIAGGRFRSGPWRDNRNRAPDIELDESERDKLEIPKGASQRD
jgi:hypothetical protein